MRPNHALYSAPALDSQSEPAHPQVEVEEHVAGELPEPAIDPAAVAFEIASKLLVSALLLPLWPVYLSARLFAPRPPHLPPMRSILRLLHQIFTEQPPAPGLSIGTRVLLALNVLHRWARQPLWALAWYVDDLVYGRALARTAIVEPLFEISAARSGSTQIARYLEDDPHIVAPSLLMIVFPYVWLWKLAPRTLGRFFSEDAVRARVASGFPKEWLNRHELDALRTDTFEVAFLLAHYGDVKRSLGPRISAEDMGTSRISPENRALWEEDFLRFIDCIGRKALLHAESRRSIRPLRLMIKGHFLSVAPALERRYPDARFLTVLRDPAKRLQSVINFLRVQPRVAGVAPPPWSWLVWEALEVEPAYCDLELAWFRRTDGARRFVVRFDDYVRDLEGTMRRVYRACLDTHDLPAHVPTTHAPRQRSSYAIDRSLAQLSVDPVWLERRLNAYIAWCRTPAP